MTFFRVVRKDRLQVSHWTSHCMPGLGTLQKIGWGSAPVWVCWAFEFQTIAMGCDYKKGEGVIRVNKSIMVCHLIYGMFTPASRPNMKMAPVQSHTLDYWIQSLIYVTLCTVYENTLLSFFCFVWHNCNEFCSSCACVYFPRALFPRGYLLR